MIARPVAHYLVSFGPDGQVSGADSPIEVSYPLKVLERTPEDIDALIEEAREEGRAEGRAQASIDSEASLEAERQSFVQQLAEERGRWTLEESDKLNVRLVEGITELEARLADCVDRILRPFLAECLSRQIIEELAQSLDLVLASDEHAVVKIDGPEDLLAALQAKLSLSPVRIEYAPNSAADVTIVANRTIIESRLQAWVERLNTNLE
jgi:hypothetical protein